MFFADRYLTRGVQAAIPNQLQHYLWQKIERLCYDDSINVDYLQVFELIPIKDNKLKIIHRQEQPSYENNTS